jgi:hypothetical protein
LKLILNLAAASALAFAAMVFAIATVRIGGITSTSLSDAEMIRAQNPVRLVSPNWVSPRGGLIEWFEAETRARMDLVFVGWGIAVVWIVGRHVRGTLLKNR